MAPEAPTPTAARYYIAAARLEVDWSVHLRPAVVPVANFNACIEVDGRRTFIQPTPGYAQNHTAVMPLTNGAICFGVDRCTYTAATNPILSRGGTPAAAFFDFPCTVLP